MNHEILNTALPLSGVLAIGNIKDASAFAFSLGERSGSELGGLDRVLAWLVVGRGWWWVGGVAGAWQVVADGGSG